MRDTTDGLGWELFSQRAYVQGDWKILRLPRPFGTGEWQLYNVANDPAEVTDLAPVHPDRLGAMVSAWQTYAETNGVLIYDLDMTSLLH